MDLKYGLRPKKAGLHAPVTGRVDDAKPYLKHHDIVVLARVPKTHPKFERRNPNDGTHGSTIEGQAYDQKP